MGHYFTKTNKTLSLIISFLVLLTFSLQAQWESHSVNGLHGKFKQRAGITFKKYGDTYYAFTGDGLFTSSNMVDWNCLTCATDTSKCSDIVITSTNDTLISWKGHVHKKNGSSWDSVANIGGELFVFDSASNERIFTGSWCSGIAYSSDGGDTWTYYSKTDGEYGDGLSNVRCAGGIGKYFYYDTANNILFSSSKSKVQYSYDFGANWTWHSGDLGESASTNTRAFGGRTWIGDNKPWVYYTSGYSYSGDPTFAKSLINDTVGEHWDVAGTGGDIMHTPRTLISYGYYLFLGGSNGVQVTKDNGMSFEPFEDGLGLSEITGFFIDTVNQDSIMLFAVEKDSDPSASTINKINIADLPPLHTVNFTVIDTSNDLIDAAQIEIEGRYTTTDTLGNATAYGVERGTEVIYTITKTGYYPFTDTIDLSSAPTIYDTDTSWLIPETTFDVKFTILSKVDSSALDAAEVILNSVMQSTNAQGETTFTNVLAQNNVSFSVSKTDYVDTSGTIDIAGNVDDTLYISPVPTYDVSFTILSNVDSSAIDAAEVTLNGNMQTTNAQGQTTFNDIQSATGLSLSITKTSFKDSTTTIDVTENINDTIYLKFITGDQSVVMNDQAGAVNIYPNPATDHIKIELGENIKGDVLITISDMLGNILDQSLVSKESDNVTETIDISGLADGLYIISISDDNDTVIQKVLKN